MVLEVHRIILILTEKDFYLVKQNVEAGYGSTHGQGKKFIMSDKCFGSMRDRISRSVSQELVFK